jgi:sugar phosphate permease
MLRLTLCAAPLCAADILCRNSVNFIVPFIVEAQGFTETQAAMLLAGFFPCAILLAAGCSRTLLLLASPPHLTGSVGMFSALIRMPSGYVVTQIPAGLIARSVGEKALTSVNICANALFFCLLPAAARLGAGPLAVCLTTMGLFQGTIVPCVVGLQVYWLPEAGTEKIWASRALPLGSVVAQILASWLTPRLAVGAMGWRRVAYTYASVNLVFAVVWHALAADRPRKWRGPPAMSTAELEMLEASSPVSPSPFSPHSNSNSNHSNLSVFLFSTTS